MSYDSISVAVKTLLAMGGTPSTALHREQELYSTIMEVPLGLKWRHVQGFPEQVIYFCNMPRKHPTILEKTV